MWFLVLAPIPISSPALEQAETLAANLEKALYGSAQMITFNSGIGSKPCLLQGDTFPFPAPAGGNLGSSKVGDVSPES